MFEKEEGNDHKTDGWHSLALNSSLPQSVQHLFSSTSIAAWCDQRSERKKTGTVSLEVCTFETAKTKREAPKACSSVGGENRVQQSYTQEKQKAA